MSAHAVGDHPEPEIVVAKVGILVDLAAAPDVRRSVGEQVQAPEKTHHYAQYLDQQAYRNPRETPKRPIFSASIAPRACRPGQP
jgi:hypothetical protein